MVPAMLERARGLATSGSGSGSGSAGKRGAEPTNRQQYLQQGLRPSAVETELFDDLDMSTFGGMEDQGDASEIEEADLSENDESGRDFESDDDERATVSSLSLLGLGGKRRRDSDDTEDSRRDREGNGEGLDLGADLMGTLSNGGGIGTAMGLAMPMGMSMGEERHERATFLPQTQRRTLATANVGASSTATRTPSQLFQRHAGPHGRSLSGPPGGVTPGRACSSCGATATIHRGQDQGQVQGPRPAPTQTSSYCSTSSTATAFSSITSTSASTSTGTNTPSPCSASPDEKHGCDGYLVATARTSHAALATAVSANSSSRQPGSTATTASASPLPRPGPSRPGSGSRSPGIRVASNSAFEAAAASKTRLHEEKEEARPAPTSEGPSRRKQNKRTRRGSETDDPLPTIRYRMPDAPVLSFWGPDPVPLPGRFARIKRNLMSGHEEALEASWARLIEALKDDVADIEAQGDKLVPEIHYDGLDDPAQSASFRRELRKYGVGVVRNCVPKDHAEDMVKETVNYLEMRRKHAESNKSISPPKQDPTCFDYFWTPAQVRSRAHPHVLQAQRFMMGHWETTPENKMATRLPITYVDRIRIHGVYDGPNGLAAVTAPLPSPSENDPLPTPPQSDEPAEPLQSADDWITALQSSAGVIAQVDNGSLERWEPDGYQRAGTYDKVFHGQWEDYDSWECASRVSATMDLYNGYGACTIFRMYQGILALSTVEPGMVRLLPSPKLATAYYLLRPFFSPRSPPPEVRSGPEWDAYLAPDNWKLEREPDTLIHGAVPGHAQRITERWHPHLFLRKTMITLPTLQPGDYIFWHPDLPYHISSNGPGIATPNPNALLNNTKDDGSPGGNDITMLVYLPAAPLTQTNALYLARQRKAFQRGHPGPDFDSTGRGTVVEDPATRPGERDIADEGGPAGLQAMGLAPWEIAATRSSTPPPKPAATNTAEGPGTGDQQPSPSSSASNTSSSTTAEAEVVRLSNIILFPDHSMVGYSV